MLDGNVEHVESWHRDTTCDTNMWYLVVTPTCFTLVCTYTCTQRLIETSKNFEFLTRVIRRAKQTRGMYLWHNVWHDVWHERVIRRILSNSSSTTSRTYCLTDKPMNSKKVLNIQEISLIFKKLLNFHIFAEIFFKIQATFHSRMPWIFKKFLTVCPSQREQQRWLKETSILAPSF